MASQDITRHDTATAGSSPEDEDQENLDREESPPPAPRQYQTVARQTQETVRALRIHAGWSYPQLQVTFHISLSSLHRITHRTIIRQPSPYPTRSRHSTITEDIRARLLATATASAENRRLPYRQVAELAGITLGRNALRRVFESAGYHRRVARVKPFLSATARSRRLAWAQQFQDWSVNDWMDVIWSDECAFSVGEVCGTVWVTRRPGEEYLEDCLVPRFARCSTIMVGGSIYQDQKGPLLVWDTPTWGTITGQTYVDRIIRPYLHPWWQFLHQIGTTNSGYIYIQQDNAPAHRSRTTTNVMEELGLANYLLPWPSTSPDMNPIEGVWCLLKRRIMRRHPRPTTVPTLLTAINEEWTALSPQDIEQLTSSMPTRISELLTVCGGHTRF